MITYLTPAPAITTAAWLTDTGDRLTLIHANGDWFLAWNGPLYTPMEVCESERLMGHFRAAEGKFAADKRPEVAELFWQFEAIINAILEGVQTMELSDPARVTPRLLTRVPRRVRWSDWLARPVFCVRKQI